MSCDDEVLESGKMDDKMNTNSRLLHVGLADLCSMVHYGEQILTIAVMAILLTAPLGIDQPEALIVTLDQSEALIVTVDQSQARQRS